MNSPSKERLPPLKSQIIKGSSASNSARKSKTAEPTLMNKNKTLDCTGTLIDCPWLCRYKEKMAEEESRSKQVDWGEEKIKDDSSQLKSNRIKYYSTSMLPQTTKTTDLRYMCNRGMLPAKRKPIPGNHKSAYFKKVTPPKAQTTFSCLSSPEFKNLNCLPSLNHKQVNSRNSSTSLFVCDLERTRCGSRSSCIPGTPNSDTRSEAQLNHFVRLRSNQLDWEPIKLKKYHEISPGRIPSMYKPSASMSSTPLGLKGCGNNRTYVVCDGSSVWASDDLNPSTRGSDSEPEERREEVRVLKHNDSFCLVQRRSQCWSQPRSRPPNQKGILKQKKNMISKSVDSISDLEDKAVRFCEVQWHASHLMYGWKYTETHPGRTHSSSTPLGESQQ